MNRSAPTVVVEDVNAAVLLSDDLIRGFAVYSRNIEHVRNAKMCEHALVGDWSARWDVAGSINAAQWAPEGAEFQRVHGPKRAA